MDAPPRDEAARIERALNAEPVGWREVTRRGQTNASHRLVDLPGGSTAFVKSARGDDTASWIRDEHLFYADGPRPVGARRDPPRGAAEFAALLAGFFAAHAARPEILERPDVRTLQLRRARTALPWPARSLGLPPPR